MNKITKTVLTAKVDLLKIDEILNRIEIYIQKNQKSRFILSINPEKIYHIKNNRISNKIINIADIRIPDGAGIIWALKKLYNLQIPRITGVDLMHEICFLSSKKKYNLFFFGSSENNLNKGMKILKDRYPNINIVGCEHGYIKKTNYFDLINKINSLSVNILFIGLGSPKQENWVLDYIEKLNVNVIQTIGGSIDTLSSSKIRAPEYFQNNNLEWLYRLIRNPFRIRRQKVLLNFLFDIYSSK